MHYYFHSFMSRINENKSYAISVRACMYVWMYVCMSVCMYVCVHKYILSAIGKGVRPALRCDLQPLQPHLPPRQGGGSNLRHPRTGKSKH